MRACATLIIHETRVALVIYDGGLALCEQMLEILELTRTILANENLFIILYLSNNLNRTIQEQFVTLQIS